MEQLIPKPAKNKSGCLNAAAKGVLIFFGALIGLFGVLFIILAITVAIGMKNNKSDTATLSTATVQAKQIILVPTKIPTPTPLPTATYTPVPQAPPYNEIRLNMDAMTDAQWGQYAPRLKGLAVVNWQGWVEDVNTEGFNGYRVQVDMDSPQELFSVYDVEFEIRGNSALELQKDSVITFSGRIKRVAKVLGSMLIDIEEVRLTH